MDANREAVVQVLEQVGGVILGKQEAAVEILAALLADGHVLLEDIPGVGKTTLAVSFARLMNLETRRVQFTPDVLPSDLTGFSVYRRETERFVYQPGSVFCNLLLADEINRTSPKTQSALLEVMEERQVTVEGVTRPVPDPFFVIATQNPAGAVGTQLLPAAQMDRFLICTAVGYPDFESETKMAVRAGEDRAVDGLSPCMTLEQLRAIRSEVRGVFVSEEVAAYIVRLVSETRADRSFESGASPRATLALSRMARATAWLHGRNFVAPSDVEEQFLPCTRHRVQLSVRARMENRTRDEALSAVLARVERPALRGKKQP